MVLFITLCFYFGCNSDGCRNAQERFQKGTALLKSGDRASAYRLFAKAAHDEPSDVNYQWAAAGTAPNQQFAYFHLKAAWDNGLRNQQSLEAYAAVSSFPDKEQKQQFVLDLYKQLPDTAKSENLRATIFFKTGQYDSCIAIWQRLFNKEPSAALCNSIVKARFNQNNTEKAKEALIKAKSLNVLDEEGYVLLAVACIRLFDYKGATGAFETAKKAGAYHDGAKLAHGRMLIAQEKMDAAFKVLGPLLTPSAGSADNTLNQQARIAAAYARFLNRDTLGVDSIKMLARGELPVIAAEKALYRLFVRRLTDSADIRDSLMGVMKRIPEYPEIDMIFAWEIGSRGKPEDALAIFKRLPDIYFRSARVIVERARLMDLLGRDNEALTLLSAMHARNIFTQQSLELLRDIAFRQNRLEDAWKAQHALASRFKNDVDVRWAGGILAMRSGKLDSALAIFTGLYRAFPQEPRFNVQRIAVYLLKGDYGTVIKECEKDKTSSADIARLLARAFDRKKMFPQADSVYRTAIAARKNTGLMIEYAEFLSKNGRFAESAARYDEILAGGKETLSAYTTTYAALLNNYAWSLLQANSRDRKKVLSTIQKANELRRDNTSILDTYAAVLIAYGDNAECIKLLEGSSKTAGTPALQVRLATAYEHSGDLNKAVRTLQEALKSAPAGSIDTMEIQSRINKILSQIKE